MSHPRPRISANTLHVDELVDRALLGRVRTPAFQRGIKWRAHDVQQLFDSIYRGFPIGTLLMWKRPAPEAEVRFGPIRKTVDATDDAWWVVDGQQRLTSLVAALHHPEPDDLADRFVVYVDLDADEKSEASPFFRPHRLRPAGASCMPLAGALDATAFQTWLLDFVARTGRRDLIARASDVVTRIRNYRVPVYVVETDDAETAREMFLRTNRAGRRLELHEVFAALAPATSAPETTPDAIARRLGDRYGAIEPNAVTKVAQALEGDDVTRLRAKPWGTDAFAPLMERTERALEMALDFIVEAGVPHPRLMPHRLTPLVALARFFARFDAPAERNRRLLRRWLWRGFFADALGSDAKTFRRAVVAVRDDENKAVQALLTQVPAAVEVRLPSAFDARKGTARLAMLVLALERPVPPTRDAFDASHRDDLDDISGDVFDWLEAYGAATFCKLPGAPNTPEARFITPGVTPARMLAALRGWAAEAPDHPALASHLVTPEAARALLDDDLPGFLAGRRARLLDAARAAHAAYAEPDHSDRPPLLAADPAP